MDYRYVNLSLSRGICPVDLFTFVRLAGGFMLPQMARDAVAFNLRRGYFVRCRSDATSIDMLPTRTWQHFEVNHFIPSRNQHDGQTRDLRYVASRSQRAIRHRRRVIVSCICERD